MGLELSNFVSLFPTMDPLFECTSCICLCNKLQNHKSMLLLLLILPFSFASICSKPNEIAFTGLKVTNTYQVSRSSLPSVNFLVFTHCTKGRADYETAIKLGKEEEFDFKQLVCLSEVKTSPKSLLEKVMDALHKVTNGKSEKAEKQTPDSGTKCFKLSRRRKYSRLSLPFYVPYTFVGGLYECSSVVDCAPSNPASTKYNLSLPVPLLADDVTNHWFTMSSQDLTLLIPYLKTPPAWDVRFDKKGDWAREIRINESYIFQEPPTALSPTSLMIENFIMNTLVPFSAGKFNTNLSSLPNSSRFAMLLASVPANQAIDILRQMQNLWN